MIDNLSGPMARVNSSVDGSVSKIQRMNQSFGDMTKTGIAMAATGAQITSAVLSPVEATFETRRALGELASLGVKDLGTLENAAKDFSDTWAGTTKADFITAAYDIKSGISSLTDEAVAKYTELAGITAKGTKSSIAEMTSLFATGYGIYKGFYKDLNDMEFGEMFSAGIAKSVQQFKTNGSQMAQSIQTLGASATSSNVPLEEQLSILGMLQATMSGSEAGTKYKAFLRSAAKAGEELGLSFTDANNQLLSMPEILEQLRGKFGDTMDAAEKMELQKAFGTDEAVAMIDLLYNKTGDLQSNITTLYGEMGKGIDVARGMANAINETEGEKYIRLQQRIRNVKEEIGNQLLPTVNMLLSKGEVVLGKISDWIERNQQLIKIIALVVLTIGIVLTVLGSLIVVVGGVGLIFTKTANMAFGFGRALTKIPDMLTTIRIQAMYAGDAIKAGFGHMKSLASTAVSGVKSVTTSIISMGKAAIVNGATAIKNFVISMASMARQAITTAVTAMPGLIASVWSFTAALLANPITWVVIGIVALIAAIILLWQNWDSVTAWIQGVWNGFVNGIKAGFDWIRNLFSGMPTWLQIAIAAFMPFIGIPMLIINNWDSIVAFFSNLWVRVKGTFTSGIQGIKDFITGTFAWFRESGSKILTTFTEGIKSAVSAPIEAVKGGLSKIRKLLPFSDAKEGPLSTLTLSGRRIFETITSGMVQTQNLPAEVTENAFADVGLAASSDGSEDGFSNASITAQDEIKKVNLREITKEKSESKQSSKEKDNATIIKKLIVQVDISKLKDLPMLFKLLKEIEDYTNGNGSDLTLVGEG
jgi:TP901 family phage tail tape measure protein